MIQIMRNGSDISRYVVGISPIAYRRNDIGTFELPEITIESALAGAVAGDLIDVRESSTAIVSFYIDSVTYDYSTKLYTWSCPHILAKLKEFYAREISVNWADISPSYAQYNFQSGSDQGQNIWERRYWQVLFLMQTLIRKATGIAVNSVNVASVTGNSMYYTRALNEFSQWATHPITYDKLGVSQPGLIRLGSKTHLDHTSTDYDVYGGLPTCLDVLCYLCASAGLYIDIFRSDYRIAAFAEASAPSVSIQLGREDRDLDLYRFYETSAQRLVSGAFDYVYGTFDDLGLFVPYTYGVQDADYELTRYARAAENLSAPGRRKLTAAWPTMFKIYGISNNGTYQSNIYNIIDAENTYDWLQQWMIYLTDYWFDRTLARTYIVPFTGLLGGGRMVEYDVSQTGNTKKYEVLS